MATSRKTTAAGKTAAGNTARDDADQDGQETTDSSPKGMADRLQKLNLTGAAGAMLDSGRKDLKALMQANEQSYKGLQAVMKRQTELLKSSIGEWQRTVGSMSGKDPKENLAKLDEMGRAAFQRALDDMKELAQLAAKAQADSFDVMRQRISDNVEQVSKLLQKPRGK
ncbi:MAG: phasin [Variovorax sp.]|nr:phasin [Variovorax sp.]